MENRRRFLGRVSYAIAVFFGYGIISSQGFFIGSKATSIGRAEAEGSCGASYNCAGGCGKCGAVPAPEAPAPAGRATTARDKETAAMPAASVEPVTTARVERSCGASYNCTGQGNGSDAGGKCGASYSCTGGAGACGSKLQLHGTRRRQRCRRQVWSQLQLHRGCRLLWSKLQLRWAGQRQRCQRQVWSQLRLHRGWWFLWSQLQLRWWWWQVRSEL